MSDATKAKAQEKLASFTVKIGYPGQVEGLLDASRSIRRRAIRKPRNAGVWATKDNLEK